MTTHSAPAVVYRVGRSRLQGLALLLVWLSACAVVSLWFEASRKLDWAMALTAATLLGSGAAAYLGWKNAPLGQLAWDGQVWRWESTSYQTGIAEQQLAVIADFQHLMLLRIENQAHASLWLWPEKVTHPARWMDLRRAVYSSKKPQARYKRRIQQAERGQTDEAELESRQP